MAVGRSRQQKWSTPRFAARQRCSVPHRPFRRDRSLLETHASRVSGGLYLSARIPPRLDWIGARMRRSGGDAKHFLIRMMSVTTPGGHPSRRTRRSDGVRRCTGERSRPPLGGCGRSTDPLRADCQRFVDWRLPGLVGPALVDSFYRVQPLGTCRNRAHRRRRGGPTSASPERCFGGRAGIDRIWPGEASVRRNPEE